MDLTLRLRGKVVRDVQTNGHALRISTDDGAELEVVWLDDNGRPIKGRPAIIRHGVRLAATGVHDIVHYPTLLTKGCA